MAMRALSVCLLVVVGAMVVRANEQWTSEELDKQPNVGCHNELGGVIQAVADKPSNGSVSCCSTFHFPWQQAKPKTQYVYRSSPICKDVNGAPNPGPFGGPNGKPVITYSPTGNKYSYFTMGYGEYVYMIQTPNGLPALYAPIPQGHDFVCGIEVVRGVLYLITTKQIYYSTPQGFNKTQSWFPLEIPFGADISLGSGTEVTTDGVDQLIMTGTRNALYFYNITARVRVNTITLSRPADEAPYAPGNQLFYHAKMGIFISSSDVLFRLTQAQLLVGNGVLQMVDKLLIGSGAATLTTSGIWFQLAPTSNQLLIWDLGNNQTRANARIVDFPNASAVIGNFVFFS